MKRIGFYYYQTESFIKALFFLIAISFVYTFAHAAPEIYSPQECPVVGNTDSKKYHMPGQRHYAKMLRKNKNGDNRKCFKTEREAESARFMKSKV